MIRNTAEGKIEGLDPVKHVPRRYFCCGSSMLYVMSVRIWSSAIWSVE